MKLARINIALKKIDWPLYATVCLLGILGLILIYSVALGSQVEQNYLNFKKQIVFFILSAVIVFLIAIFLDYRALVKYNTPLYILGIILLLAVLFFGKTIRGTTGWFDLGVFSFQPIEFVKIFLMVFISKFFSDKAKYINQFKYLVLSGLGVILVMMLVILQPDFGSALVLLIVWLVLILLTGIKKSHLFFLGSIFIIICLISWFFVLAPYQKERIKVFLDPSLDPLGSGYNVTQAIIAIGSGNIFGKGLTSGSQSQLRFLPESQTDFIFAVLAEELGLIGVLLLLGLWAIIFWRLINIAKKVYDNFALYLIISIGTLFFTQLIINIGGNLGLLPITGITLPFVSYGGSSLLACMIMVGLIESINVRN
ncbi:rod shape-determining protein RodA [Candidatus Falkowbacteria bacterium]|nr:rod shape-determining protein RodA [Candidatus Falkowbacteria bacterium]